MMDEEYYKQLVKRYLDDKSSDKELEVFAHLIREGKLDHYLTAALNAEAGISPEDDVMIHPIGKGRNIMPAWLKYFTAAALLLFSAAVFYVRTRSSGQPAIKTELVKNDVLPGGNKAILTLANGKKIVLDKAENGTIAKQGNISVDKIQDGSLVYQSAADQGTDTGNDYNTISTPKGGEYAVTLPDGSKIWLNAVSSVTFPTTFTGIERKVTITGEVYFEVAKDITRPFLVETKGQTVRVLGTHFNVNAYEDEHKIKTTLLEGSIKIDADNSSKVLRPGQQAEVSGNRIRIIDGVNTDAVVAWKNGYFIFDNTDLPSLMHQLSRWYGVNIIYSGDPGEHEFVGEIKRKTNLSNVLKILAVSGVRFKIENANLYIQPGN
jgi:transmembrane sensor